MTTPANPASDNHPLALLGHELRTPLNAIIGYAEAMRLQSFGPLAAPYDEQAAIIHAAAMHLLRLTEDMTAVAQAEAGLWRGRRERFDIGEATGELVAMLAQRVAEKDIRIRAELPPPPCSVLADRRALDQILLNLLDNALKFTAPGGEIAVSVDLTDGELVLSVADSGGASGPEAKGQGLGLRLARALAESHGGSLVLGPSPAGGMIAETRLALTSP